VFDCLFSPRDGSVRLAANGPITEGNSLLFLIYSGFAKFDHASGQTFIYPFLFITEEYNYSIEYAGAELAN